jgi:hypothetical protein
LPEIIRLPEPLVVRVTAEIVSDLSFTHDCSEVRSREPLLLGTTRWISAFDAKLISIAWRWALIETDVVCIESPLAIEANLYVVGEDPSARRRRLNLLIAHFEWQPTVLRCIRAAGHA